MSVDILQEKIRKTKSPIIVDLSVDIHQIPASVRQDKSAAEAYYDFCSALLDGLKDRVPGVRFDFNHCALLGALDELSNLMNRAQEMGFYVILDAPSVLTPAQAERAAKLLDDHYGFPCNGLVTNPYIGSDAIKPFLPYCKEGKSVFFAVRSANKSAAELQDMMTGVRLVHVAAADHVKRLGESVITKSGYSQLGVLTAATNANAVMGLRSKFNRMFLLVDGLDYPGGNGKNCSYGFDRFGHGCALSVGPAITAAWTADGCNEADYAELAVQAAERIRSNMTRYITIL
jgi:orotidine-5'-phosphate decarboxylase